MSMLHVIGCGMHAQIYGPAGGRANATGGVVVVDSAKGTAHQPLRSALRKHYEPVFAKMQTPRGSPFPGGGRGGGGAMAAEGEGGRGDEEGEDDGVEEERLSWVPALKVEHSELYEGPATRGNPEGPTLAGMTPFTAAGFPGPASTSSPIAGGGAAPPGKAANGVTSAVLSPAVVGGG